MLRTHCAKSDKPIILRDVSDDMEEGGCYKPRGFWYEVDGDWQRWTDAEDFGCGTHIFSVDLRDCNVLKIDNVLDLDIFHERYAEVKRRYSPEIDWAAGRASLSESGSRT